MRAVKTNKAKKRGIAGFIAAVCTLLLFFCAMLLFNAFYSDVYDMPEVHKGELDFSGYSTLDKRSVAYNLAGEWEFFYNRWIVTDGEDDARPDGLISLPGRWTGKNFGGGALTADGYASYRLTVKNMPAGDTVWVYRAYYVGAYRVYVNGVLNCESGSVSKDKRQTRSGYPARKTIATADGGDMEIVIELSACDTGGLSAAPWINHGKPISAGWNAVYDTRTAMFGVAVAAFLFILFMTIGFYRYEKTWAYAVLSGLLTLHFSMSKDLSHVLGMPLEVSSVIGFISGAALIVAFGAVFAAAGAPMNKRLRAVVSSVFCACLCAYAALRATDLAFVPVFIGIASSTVMLYPLCTSTKIKPWIKAAYTSAFTVTAGILLLEAADGMGVLVFGTESIFTFTLLAVIVLASAAMCFRIAAAAKVIMRTNELERELFFVKQDALQARIKPHFVFNSLTAIQALYRNSTQEGEAQLLRFAEYLRTNIDAHSAALIPFTDEVEHVLNYFELENLRRGGALNLLLDIRCEDFKVPVLSLQPLVENAVKHARTDEKADGYISLSSEKTAGGITVTVADNGIGFDPLTVARHVGLDSAVTRFDGLLGAHTEIKSKQGVGTEIIIFIPDDRNKRITTNNENSSC